MIDFRYHALSLIAVLVALAVGLLVGVSIGDAGLISSAERALREDVEQRVQDARDETRALQAVLARRDEYEQRSFGAVAGDRLRGRRIAVVFLHDAEREAFDDVRAAVEEAGGDLVSVSSMREPLDLAAVAEATGIEAYESLADDPELAENFARRMGRQLVGGGRLLREIRRELLESSSGVFEGAEGVVVVRTDPGERPEDAPDPEPFIEAFVDGLQSFETPVAGVELISTDPSQIGWYSEQDLASVDNVDEVSGRASLVYALSGAADGAYGIKDTADALVPVALSEP